VNASCAIYTYIHTYIYIYIYYYYYYYYYCTCSASILYWVRKPPTLDLAPHVLTQCDQKMLRCERRRAMAVLTRSERISCIPPCVSASMTIHFVKVAHVHEYQFTTHTQQDEPIGIITVIAIKTDILPRRITIRT